MIQMSFLSIKDIDPSLPIKGFGEQFSYGIQMLLLGIGTVFSVLCILWACLSLFKFFFHDLPKNRNTVTEINTDTAEETAQVTSDDGEIIAAIAAAVAMAESENEHVKFRVVSFRRK